MPRLLVWRLFTVFVAACGLAAPYALSAQNQNNATVSDGKAFVRGADGRWEPLTRQLTDSDIPSSSPLRGVKVKDSSDGKSATVVQADTVRSSLHPGDLVDEIQIAGILNRKRQANPGFWPYQVWGASDFYRLAVQCASECLIRLRGPESTTFGVSQTVSGPRVFGYILIGSGPGFRETLDDSARKTTGFIDTQTGEPFGPPASTAFAQTASIN